MATFIARIAVRERVREGGRRVARTDLLRHEYWRGAQPRTYYTFGSFRDARAFIAHEVRTSREAEGADHESRRRRQP